MTENIDPVTGKAYPEQDPVTTKSMGFQIAFWTFLTMLSLVWAFYDEFWGKRPYMDYQSDFQELYVKHLEDKVMPTAREDYEFAKDEPEVVELDQKIEEEFSAIKPDVDALTAELAALSPKIDAISEGYREKNSMIAALRYQIDKSEEGSEKRTKLLGELEELRSTKVEITFPEGETKAYDSTEFDEQYSAWKDQRAEKQIAIAKLMKPVSDLRKEWTRILALKVPNLAPGDVENLITKTKDMKRGIKQIHVKEFDLVDRCESCHLGAREPVSIKAEDVGNRPEFVSHPNPELLRIHDPERFGCSPCHNGNGIGTISAEKGHGRHKFWLWPLYYPENYEAGCVQCHKAEIYVEHAETLNHGRELFRHKGCWGCHRYDGYDRVTEELLAIDQDIASVQTSIDQASKMIALGEDPQKRNAAHKVALIQEKRRLVDQRDDMKYERKRVGPSLKEIRYKLQPYFMEPWIKNPQAFRPSTKMPHFRLTDDEVKTIAAYLWQKADDPSDPELEDRKLGTYAKGETVRGKELFELRGCQACHAVGEGENALGSDWAANLSRVGEKANYEYLVEWILNPRGRNPHAVMPNLRLTMDEARHVASYLMTLKSDSPIDPNLDTSYLTNAGLLEEGDRLIKHYGCAGCHEIGGLEDEGRIGTELTAWGAKPIERLDFGLHTHEAEKGLDEEGNKIGKWYNHKGFAERKLRTPDFYEKGKHFQSHYEALRMPNFHLSEDEISALTTFLLGSVEPNYHVSTEMGAKQEGARKDITEGWWIAQKYNCLSCHKMRAEDKPSYWQMPRFEAMEQASGSEAIRVMKDRPPSLIGIGARLDPEWLAEFLRNPALSDTDLHRNGVRSYVETRMPTFDLSEREIAKLIRFFRALSEQPETNLPQPVKSFTGPDDPDLAIAKGIVEQACNKCHDVATFTKDWGNTPGAPLQHAHRLNRTWIKEWLIDPTVMIVPLTGMPSLFTWNETEQRWILTGDASVKDLVDRYKGDHVELLQRYLVHVAAKPSGE